MGAVGGRESPPCPMAHHPPRPRVKDGWCGGHRLTGQTAPPPDPHRRSQNLHHQRAEGKAAVHPVATDGARQRNAAPLRGHAQRGATRAPHPTCAAANCSAHWRRRRRYHRRGSRCHATRAGASLVYRYVQYLSSRDSFLARRDVGRPRWASAAARPPVAEAPPPAIVVVCDASAGRSRAVPLPTYSRATVTVTVTITLAGGSRRRRRTRQGGQNQTTNRAQDDVHHSHNKVLIGTGGPPPRLASPRARLPPRGTRRRWRQRCGA